MDHTLFLNYRPVSNLTLIRKAIEKSRLFVSDLLSSIIMGGFDIGEKGN